MNSLVLRPWWDNGVFKFQSQLRESSEKNKREPATGAFKTAHQLELNIVCKCYVALPAQLCVRRRPQWCSDTSDSSESHWQNSAVAFVNCKSRQLFAIFLQYFEKYSKLFVTICNFFAMQFKSTFKLQGLLKPYNRQKRFRQKRFRSFQAISIV